jgi:hypothetical protein
VKSKPDDDAEGELLNSKYQDYNAYFSFMHRRYQDGGRRSPGKEETIKGSNAYVTHFALNNALTSGSRCRNWAVARIQEIGIRKIDSGSQTTRLLRAG